MLMFSKKPTYSQAELGSMLHQIKELNSLRDQSLQKARLYTKDVNGQAVYQAEADRYSIEIKVAQQVYGKMLEKTEREV